MHLDPDVRLFLWTVGTFLVFLPYIKSKIKLPPKLQFNEIPETALSAQQRVFFEAYDQKLAPLGYLPAKTFAVPNLTGTNLSRAYSSAADPASIGVTTITHKGKGHNSVEIVTTFQDGKKLSTRNANLSSVFAELPGRTSQRFPGIADPVALKREHDKQAEKMKIWGAVFIKPEQYFTWFQDHHQRFLQHQVSKGLLKLNPKTGIYEGTYRTALQGIGNFLNPFADNFTPLRFASGIVAGCGIPLSVIHFARPIAQQLNGVGGALSYVGLLALAYIAAGLFIGYLFSSKSFIWAFLLGWLPLRIMHIPASTFYIFILTMSWVAHYTSSIVLQRRRLT